MHHLVTLIAYRPRYGSHGHGSGIFIYYLLRWLYTVIGAWAYAVYAAILSLCILVRVLLGGDES